MDAIVLQNHDFSQNIFSERKIQNASNMIQNAFNKNEN